MCASNGIFGCIAHSAFSVEEEFLRDTANPISLEADEKTQYAPSSCPGSGPARSFCAACRRAARPVLRRCSEWSLGAAACQDAHDITHIINNYRLPTDGRADGHTRRRPV